MAETIKDRLKQLAQNKGLSIRSFEETCGLGRGNVSNMSQDGSIGSDKLSKIFDAFPDTDLYWLLTGNGEMIKGGTLPVAHQTTSPKEGIPLIPLSAMAGALTGEQTVLEYECERYVVPAFNGADFLIPVKGNSMNPTYVSGDIVACQRVPMADLFFQWNKPYVLDTAQGVLIKRIKPGSDKEHVLIVSDNAQYDPFELPYSEIHAVALVIGIIRLE